MLESAVPLTRENCQSVFTHYDLCSDLGRPIPEGEFLKLKRRHLCKVAISRYLDTHPAQSLTLIRARISWRDNGRLRKGLLKLRISKQSRFTGAPSTTSSLPGL